MWKHLHGDWSQIPAKRTNTKPTAWLQTNPTTASFAFLATTVATVRIYSFFCIARTEHSSDITDNACFERKIFFYKVSREFVTLRFINMTHNSNCACRSASRLSLRAGSTYSNSGGTIHQVSQVIRHGSYNEDTIDYDIALLRVCTVKLWLEYTKTQSNE
jgi:hypothetical protein